MNEVVLLVAVELVPGKSDRELAVLKPLLWNKARMAWMFCTSGLVATVMPLGRTSMGVQARAARSTRLSVTGRAGMARQAGGHDKGVAQGRRDLPTVKYEASRRGISQHKSQIRRRVGAAAKAAAHRERILMAVAADSRAEQHAHEQTRKKKRTQTRKVVLSPIEARGLHGFKPTTH